MLDMFPDAPSPELDKVEPLYSSGWLACEHPERPVDRGIRFHWGECRGCAIVAAVILNQVDPLTHPNACSRIHEILDMVAPIEEML